MIVPARLPSWACNWATSGGEGGDLVRLRRDGHLRQHQPGRGVVGREQVHLPPSGSPAHRSVLPSTAMITRPWRPETASRCGSRAVASPSAPPAEEGRSAMPPPRSARWARAPSPGMVCGYTVAGLAWRVPARPSARARARCGPSMPSGRPVRTGVVGLDRTQAVCRVGRLCQWSLRR
jgi:hypothetical protein